MWAIASPEMYLLLLEESGWTLDQYEAWVAALRAPKVLSVLYALIIPAHRDRTTALMEDLQRLGTGGCRSRAPA